MVHHGHRISGAARSLHARLALVVAVLGILLAVSFLLGLSTGAGRMDVAELIRAIFDEKDAMVQAVFYRIRFPRVLAAAFSGAALSLGGMVFRSC